MVDENGSKSWQQQQQFIGSYWNFYKININIYFGPIRFRCRSRIEKISLMAYAGKKSKPLYVREKNSIRVWAKQIFTQTKSPIPPPP